MHLFYALLVWIVLPESLTKRQMSAARARHEEALKGLKDAQDAGVAVGLLMRMQRAFAFLSPLMLFVPARVESVNPLKAGTRNWNLTFVAVSYGLVMMIMVRLVSFFTANMRSYEIRAGFVRVQISVYAGQVRVVIRNCMLSYRF